MVIHMNNISMKSEFAGRITSEELAWQQRGSAPDMSSEKNFSRRFAPAFLHRDTGHWVRAQRRNGEFTPVHCGEGLPVEWVDGGFPKNGVVAGFVRCGVFYTREQAAWIAEREEALLG